MEKPMFPRRVVPETPNASYGVCVCTLGRRYRTEWFPRHRDVAGKRSLLDISNILNVPVPILHKKVEILLKNKLLEIVSDE